MTASPRAYTADRGDAGRRLDLVVHRHLHDVREASRSRVQAWIEEGRVRVDDVLVRRVSTRVALGAVVVVCLPADIGSAEPHAMAPEDVPLSVLYEDGHLLVIDKPPGVVVHPAYKHVAGTVLHALLGRARVWPAPQRPSIVGRLDKLTSGIVVAAKSAAAHAALQRAMAAADAEKVYLAVVYGRVNVTRGEIRCGLRRDPGDRRRMMAAGDGGVDSLTRFERLARVAAPNAGLTLVRCTLVTGRTHQIRVHFASRGWPLVGDPVYGEPRWSAVGDPGLAAALEAFPRQALHAWRLGLTHPVTGARICVEAPVPADLTALLSTTGLGERASRAQGFEKSTSRRAGLTVTVSVT